MANVELLTEERMALKEEIESFFGTDIEYMDDKGIEVYDEYSGKLFLFRYAGAVDFEELFEFNGLNIQKEKLFSVLGRLDRNLFMTIDKIIFINSEEDYDNLYGILEYDVFDDLESDLARYLFLDNMIIINMIALRKVAREIGFPEKKELNIGLFTTLLHELRHAHQANPLLGSEFNDRSWEELEDDAEEYCSRVFEEIIANEDYFVI